MEKSTVDPASFHHYMVCIASGRGHNHNVYGRLFNLSVFFACCFCRFPTQSYSHPTQFILKSFSSLTQSDSVLTSTITGSHLRQHRTETREGTNREVPMVGRLILSEDNCSCLYSRALFTGVCDLSRFVPTENLFCSCLWFAIGFGHDGKNNDSYSIRIG